jgi:hypothetical protein
VLCVFAAAGHLVTVCRGQADTWVWYNYCFMRYDDGADFSSLPDTGYTLVLNQEHQRGPPEYDRARRAGSWRVAPRSANTVTSRLARETTKLDLTTTIFKLGWCTRNITAADYVCYLRVGRLNRSVGALGLSRYS